MKKPFLLIMGDNYYPCRGTGDWVEAFESYEEAEEKIKYIEEHEEKYDWHKIVDLRNWTE